ncbi:HK97 gp10 family phage protein [Streptomyces gilvifuscus]|uniref:HK97 gp10 family phage protein n=1 Tax=Streptomyces gilvifuscus TaxID=1550617 RepID=A0ABT5FLK3_9ACTN|nr:HK97 gp10 family phage protein [Streptomyces gilvifuscus]MDC2953385.1 HK97 gp10 family phage protein [Streptomyces gilvifuscus]
MGAFKPDHAAIAALVHEDFVQADLHERADHVVAVAKGNAPVDTGRYRDSIHAEDSPDGSVLIVSDVEYAAVIELGTRDAGHPAHHTIANALDAARD